MATGLTGSQQIRNAVRLFVAEMQYTQEHEQMMVRLVDTRELPKNMGLTYNEPYVGAITAMEAAMDQEFNNPQQITDQKITITPTEKIVQVLWPKRLNLYISESFPRIAGRLMANALEYKRDVDLLTLLASTTGVIGNGTQPLTVGLVSAAMSVIGPGIPANGSVARVGARPTGDPSDGPYYCLAHPFNAHDLRSQLSGLGTLPGATSGAVGTVTAPSIAGLTDVNMDWIRRHYRGQIAEAEFLVNGNLAITSNAVKGGVWSKDAFVHVTYQGVQNFEYETQDGRFVKQTAWVDYGFGQRVSVWAQQLFIDATPPTS
jgi:hypothetical protein